MQQTHGEYAVALDLLRWVHATNVPALDLSWPRSRALYSKVLLHVAEERAAAAVGLEHSSAALDMATDQISGHSFPSEQLVSFQPYCSQLTGREYVLFDITPEEKELLTAVLGCPDEE